MRNPSQSVQHVIPDRLAIRNARPRRGIRKPGVTGNRLRRYTEPALRKLKLKRRDWFSG
jgi:hypothetical protein